MIVINDNYSIMENIATNFSDFKTDDAQVGYNGLTGFKAWECYMIVKYGNPGKFGVGGKEEYLIELPIYPDQVSEQISANWTPQNVLGRSAPIAAYANTSLKSVSFSLDLHRDLLTGSYTLDTETAKTLGYKGGGADVNDKSQLAGYQKQTARGPFNTRSWYTSINKMLQISCYPQYTSNGMIPPTTYFIFGQMILKGFVNSYSTEWKKPIINTFYGWNSVTINMDCYPDSIISANDMITNKRDGTASTQNTYNTVFPNNVGSSNVMTRSETINRSNARTSSSIGGGVRDT